MSLLLDVIASADCYRRAVAFVLQIVEAALAALVKFLNLGYSGGRHLFQNRVATKGGGLGTLCLCDHRSHVGFSWKNSQLSWNIGYCHS